MMKSSALVDHSPPTSTSRPLDVIYMISVPRPFPFFGALLLLCMILNTNQRTETRHYREEESKPSFLAAAILQAIKPPVFG